MLLELEKGDNVYIEYFIDGHIFRLTGIARVDVFNQKIYVGAFEINFDDIRKIEKK